MNQTATDFLTRCFAPGESIALLLRRDNGDRPTQRIVRLEQVLTSRYLGWLAQENTTGANVYVAANPLRSGSRRRTKESVSSVRHLYIDIDSDGDARIAALLASDAVPVAAILSTSPGKYQVLWRVEGFGVELQKALSNSSP
jgi:DNA primase RepB-like protein